MASARQLPTRWRNSSYTIPSACESAAGPGPSGSCIGLASSALTGFQLYDEPSVADFQALATWAASVATRAPGTLRFINLLPNYASPTQLGAASYREYLEAFVTTVRPDMLCFDHYPVFGPGSDTSDGNLTQAGYIRNLAAVRSVSLASRLPFYNFFGAMPFNNRSDLSESRMRWQVYTSLAHGARGVLYFCYWTPIGDSFVWGGALMVPRVSTVVNASNVASYGPGPHYWHAARINSKLRLLGSFLLDANSTAVLAGNGSAASSVGTVGVSGPIARFGGSGAGPAWSLLLGVFALPPSRLPHSGGVLVVNQDPDAPCLATLELLPSWRTEVGASVWEVDGVTGGVAAVWDDAPSLPGLQLMLDAGDARLLLF